ncbi:MAG TPA: cupin domain-containing protein [Gemmatimonadota bacterium]|nr:cupin domain-containing protein [Gemmatimonadota bacterium]
MGAWVVPPGKTSAPYHAHYVNEEMALVLGGELSVRLNGAEHALTAGDVVALPPGADSVHQFLNRYDRPAHMLLASTMIERELVEYSDSGKRGVGLRDLAREPDAEWILIKDGRVLPSGEDDGPYFEGEPVGEPLGVAPEPPAERDRRIVGLGDLPWEPYAFGPFAGERKRPSRMAGARLLGYSVYRLRPGQRSWPYHFQHVNEEFFYVRSGYARLRTEEGERDLRPGDSFLCPPGPGGAHAVSNAGDSPLEYFALSTMEEPEVSEYPDSGKLYVLVGAAPGGDAAARSVDLVFRRQDAVDYEAGER